MDYYENFDKKSTWMNTLNVPCLFGRRIYIVNGDKIPVTAKEIDRDCRLKVEHDQIVARNGFHPGSKH
ncbi:MAG: hypothetical protein V8R90_02315 [Eubacterium sp.]